MRLTSRACIHTIDHASVHSRARLEKGVLNKHTGVESQKLPE